MAIKGIIALLILINFDKTDAIKIHMKFYYITFITYFIFFIFYFIADNESSKHLANAIYVVTTMLIPGYLLTTLLLLFRAPKTAAESLLFVSIILLGIILPKFGFERGLSNMSYNIIDIILFVLMLIQLMLFFYTIFLKKYSSK